VLSTYTKETKLGTNITAKENSDVVTLHINDKSIEICVTDFKDLAKIIKRVETDLDENPEEFELA